MIVCVGDLLVDVVCTLRDPLRRGTDAFATNVFRQGGSAANVAAAAARLGTPVRFVGAVGADPFAQYLVDDLTAQGVEVCAPVMMHVTTGTVVVLVEPDGERTMVPDRGASAHLGPADRGWLTGASVLHIPLYAFEVGPLSDTALTLVSWAHQSDVTVSIDLSAVSLLEKLGPDGLAGLASALVPDIVFANHDESAVAGAFRTAPVFIEKNGAGPVNCFAGGSLIATVAVPPIGSVPDTTGAGDAFAAGFLSAHLGSAGVAECAARGSDAAAQILRSNR